MKQLNSRSKYKGINKIGKPPSRRQMKLQGKTVYGESSSNFGKSVWKKTIVGNKGNRQTIYILHKCDKPGCEGNLEYDERNYKICCICGLSINFDNNIENKNKLSLNKSDYTNTYYNKPVESIDTRNRFWDMFSMDEFIYSNDKGADKLKERYKNVRNFEKTIKKRVL